MNKKNKEKHKGVQYCTVQCGRRLSQASAETKWLLRVGDGDGDFESETPPWTDLTLDRAPWLCLHVGRGDVGHDG